VLESRAVRDPVHVRRLSLSKMLSALNLFETSDIQMKLRLANKAKAGK